jgi:hypothetical protein
MRRGRFVNLLELKCWLQVAVAVLLENFINHTLKVEEEEKKKMQDAERSRAEV